MKQIQPMIPILFAIIFLGLLGSCLNHAKQADKKTSLNDSLAVQLWTFRGELEKDVPGTLKKIKDLGFTYVEGYNAPYIVGNPDNFKSQLDAYALTMFALYSNPLSARLSYSSS